MSAPAISVEGLGKLYHLAHETDRHSSFREALTAAVLSPVRRFRQLRGTAATTEDFWALRDVNFTVAPGEVVGIVGRNGAGKSTLLKILSRIAEPTEGCAVMRGRIASLLEVGTGFHPELSGRENIFLNGSILGMKRREIAAKFDDIVAFAEVERFLDTPVKRYSSGMYVRLAFAVAAHLQPEILIVDEVLAVGDAEFQKRCIGRMKEVSSNEGRTVLFVSHNMAAISTLCTRAILLANGAIASDGSCASIIEKYLGSLSHTTASGGDLSDAPGRPAGCVPHFISIELLDGDSRPASVFAPGAAAIVRLGLKLSSSIRAPKIGVGVDNARKERIFAIATYLSPTPIDRVERETVVEATFTIPPLYPGSYSLDISLSTEEGPFIDKVEDATSFEVLEDGFLGSSHPYFSGMGVVLVPSRWSARVLDEVQ
jgi:lipopolysaccharide transport system ATP-binding protein